ncbi:Uncharacterized protein FWK35_00028687 [Aphis craccivora]|uniref:Uncharacterized protein n=1 Tax=Aphis craccivora TaxID=307492 RepID=A0A6G0VWD8_APHCR|nr:Uncharacterized protein FWK35_00028687 [Aphis craccivora]
MAGSITNNATLYQKKTFIYVPPAPTTDLIDCSNFILDFVDRKFLNVGFDSEDKFNIVIHIITPSRYVSIYEGFLRRLFSLMGNILSFILDVPQKCRKQIFLEDEFTAMSNMVYRGENVLVNETKKKEGCRVLLDRKNLLKLQYIEESIFETIARKSTIIQPVVLRQFEIIGNYIDREFTNADDIVKNIELNFVSQLKMFAAQKLAEKCLRWSKEMSPELFVDPISPLSPPIIPKKCSSPSPQYNDDNDAQPPPTKPWDITPRQLFSPCFFDGECSQINPTQATWAPTRSLPIDTSPPSPLPVAIDHGHDSDNFTQHPLWYNNRIKSTSTSHAVDENDGPTSFNNSPSILGGKPTKKSTQRNVKRKLFE